MKITASQIGAINPAYLKEVKKTSQASATDATRPADSVSLSSDVAAIDAAREAIGALPDVRQEKIEALRREIQAGTYHVPAEKIAEKILKENQLSRIVRK
jgi:negative regulator of flagellin synthesis FlgM